MLLILGAVIVAAAILIAGDRIARAVAAPARAGAGIDPLAVIQLFAPGIAAAQQDPHALLVWQPLARAARQLHPDVFAAVDRAAGATFPFTREQIEAAHARWTTDWLTWERHHDAEFKLRAAGLDAQAAAQGSAVIRAQLEAVEREKLETYQRRYQEYIRVGKALQALMK